jgi:hypothetical protein
MSGDEAIRQRRARAYPLLTQQIGPEEARKVLRLLDQLLELTAETPTGITPALFTEVSKLMHDAGPLASNMALAYLQTEVVIALTSQ